MKNIRDFLSENFQFLEVIFSIYLNRRVFVMHGLSCKCVNSNVRDFTVQEKKTSPLRLLAIFFLLE